MTEGLLSLTADVLIIGGGLAGCWAAITARQAGARVILTEKGFCGTSGVAAAAGPGHWFVPPDEKRREEAIAQRMRLSLGLGDPAWMARIIERTYETLPSIATHYRYTQDDQGSIRFHALRGPEYLRALREKALSNGVVILDHFPALELLAGAHGEIVGARGICRQGPQKEWLVRSAATILATGGCAFGSDLLGAANNTGDGLLMAAEAGATVSGMEFSSFFSIAPRGTPMSRAMIYSFARYYDTTGREIYPSDQANDHRPLAQALLNGPVLCDLSAVPDDIRRQLPQISPNVLMAFRRSGTDPFSQQFPVSLLAEGTIRGVGGVNVANLESSTGVVGLYVAGDVASREPVTGAISGGGAVNAAWALSTGCIAAEAAARHARTAHHHEQRKADGLGQFGMVSPKARELLFAAKTVKRIMLSPERQYFRNAQTLMQDRESLDTAWKSLRDSSAFTGEPRARQRAREQAAMTAAARWCAAAALARTENRGLHYRTDTPSAMPIAHIVARGIDNPETRVVFKSQNI